jgi:hypothetical protein
VVDTDLRARLEAIRAEMDALEHELGSDNAGPRAARPRRRRGLAVAGVVLAIVAVAVPVGVFAGHQFTDVPQSNTFHGSIDKIKTAGITAGCSATKYCPNDPVTRGQMAAFLTRAATRGGSFSASQVAIDGDGELVVSADIVTPGSGFVFVTVDAMAYTDDTTGCPCEIDVWLDADGDQGTSFFFGQTLDNADSEASYAAVGDNYVFPVEGKGTHTINAYMAKYSGTAAVEADAMVSLLWVPFNQYGDAWAETDPITTQSQTRPR